MLLVEDGEVARAREIVSSAAAGLGDHARGEFSEFRVAGPGRDR